jgi:hypothetical protein
MGLVEKALPIYIAWSNSFLGPDPDPAEVVTLGDIRGTIIIEGAFQTPTLRVIAFSVVADGEAGRELLTAQFRTSDSDWTLTALIHEFDADTQVIFNLRANE